MYDDFPREAEGLKFFLTSTIVCLVGLVVWLSVAQPMGLGHGAGAAEASTGY
ncbi:hypothetical protein [Rhodobacter sp. TJ_12]|uniref:hypothetical protein n=1 Tax=Rhodobacter sp. TJ_12 TaxID=2029399 RepID=UPI001CBFE491|nr:hypothetical protein [Rhodobacter sp. TJ_12]